MLKITQIQLNDLDHAEYEKVKKAIIRSWIKISLHLYPDCPILPLEEQVNSVNLTIESCRSYQIDSHDAIISLATNVLSAQTMGLSKSFIADMSSFYLTCAAEGANHTEAQEWISWILFEQNQLTSSRNQ
jgi:hypothetical protein